MKAIINSVEFAVKTVPAMPKEGGRNNHEMDITLNGAIASARVTSNQVHYGDADNSVEYMYFEHGGKFCYVTTDVGVTAEDQFSGHDVVISEGAASRKNPAPRRIEPVKNAQSEAQRMVKFKAWVASQKAPTATDLAEAMGSILPK